MKLYYFLFDFLYIIMFQFLELFVSNCNPPLFIEVSVSRHESERSCIYVLGVSILPLSTILIFDFGVGPTVWHMHILFFRFICQNRFQRYQ